MLESPTSIIESTILWKSEIDEITWEPLKLKALLSDNKSFTKEGNFFKIESEILVFGHKATYVGMLGIDLIPGPNVVIKASPAEVVKNIELNHKLKFKNIDGEYVADLKENTKLVVAPHPNQENTSMVIGAYLGP